MAFKRKAGNLSPRTRTSGVARWDGWHSVRRVAQIASFVLFVVSLVIDWSAGEVSALRALFFRLNPLTTLAALISGRALIPIMFWSLITIAATLLVGRVWCGWICPMGTLLEWIRFRKATERAEGIDPRWRTAKYVLLALILGMALTGSVTLLILDPITIISRAITTGVLPALNAAITQINTALYRVAFMRPVVSWVESVLRGGVLPSIQSAYYHSLAILALFLGVIGLNALADRFWCRYLCPLGGLLGLLSRFSLFRPHIGLMCSSCGRCSTECSMEAIQENRGRDAGVYDIIPSECTVCLDCIAACRADGIAFGRPTQQVDSSAYDPSRRQALTALATGAASTVLLGRDAGHVASDPRLIRPPGVNDVDAFLSQCVRCGECMHVCPTTGLQPSLLEDGLIGVWTPHLVPRLGPCDFSCTACGEACPTGAIPLLDLATKREQVMGMAVIDTNRCLPWAYNTPCIVCEEMCPIPDKAIRVHEVTVMDEAGEALFLQRPYVVRDLCIGCGICEHNCPMVAQAAVQVQRR